MRPNKCPKCGSNNWIIYITTGPYPEDFGNYVICDDCGVKTDLYDREYEAVKAWNECNVQEENE